METNIDANSKKSTKKNKRVFRGSTQPFKERNSINRKTLLQLRLYLAQQLFEVAVARGEGKAFGGIPAIALILKFFAQELGKTVTERQARRYAATLAQRTTDIAFHRATTRGKEWQVRMLFNLQWIRKIRTERCVRQEQESLRFKREEKRILVELETTYFPLDSFLSSHPPP